MGENGAGKSTLMKILTGIYTRDTGEVKVDGQDVNFNHLKKQKIRNCSHSSRVKYFTRFIGCGKLIFRKRKNSWTNRILKTREMNKEAQSTISKIRFRC